MAETDSLIAWERLVPCLGKNSKGDGIYARRGCTHREHRHSCAMKIFPIGQGAQGTRSRSKSVGEGEWEIVIQKMK
jgi:hypothetical protein